MKQISSNVSQIITKLDACTGLNLVQILFGCVNNGGCNVRECGLVGSDDSDDKKTFKIVSNSRKISYLSNFFVNHNTKRRTNS